MDIKYTVVIEDSFDCSETIIENLTKKHAMEVAIKEAGRHNHCHKEYIQIYIKFQNTNDINNFGYLNPTEDHSPVGKNWNK